MPIADVGAIAATGAAVSVIVASVLIEYHYRRRCRWSTPFAARTTTVRVVAVAVMLAVLAVQVRANGVLVSGDAAALRWFVAHRSPGWTRAARWVTESGSPDRVRLAGLVVAAAVAWRCRSWQRGLVLAGTVITAGYASTVLKEVVGRARPPESSRLAAVADMSFPSGHATGIAALMVGVWVAVRVGERRWPVVVGSGCVASVVVVSVALSRLYLGVHWVTDVIAGVLLGVLVASVGSLVATIATAAPRSLSRDHSIPLRSTG